MIYNKYYLIIIIINKRYFDDYLFYELNAGSICMILNKILIINNCY